MSFPVQVHWEQWGGKKQNVISLSTNKAETDSKIWIRVTVFYILHLLYLKQSKGKLYITLCNFLNRNYGNKNKQTDTVVK